MGLSQPDLRRAEPPTAMIVIVNTRKSDDTSSPVTVILATKSGSIISCDDRKAQDQVYLNISCIVAN